MHYADFVLFYFYFFKLRVVQLLQYNELLPAESYYPQDVVEDPASIGNVCFCSDDSSFYLFVFYCFYLFFASLISSYYVVTIVFISLKPNHAVPSTRGGGEDGAAD